MGSFVADADDNYSVPVFFGWLVPCSVRQCWKRIDRTTFIVVLGLDRLLSKPLEETSRNVMAIFKLGVLPNEEKTREESS